MTDTPDMFECRLVGYSKQSRKDGDWVEVRFHIHPDDVTPALAQAPLKTTFMVAATPAEKAPAKQPMDNPNSLYKPKRSWDETPLPEQAAIRCNTEHFRDWLAKHWGYVKLDKPTDCDAVLKTHFDIVSKTLIKHDTRVGNAWLALDEEYRRSCGLVTEEH